MGAQACAAATARAGERPHPVLGAVRRATTTPPRRVRQTAAHTVPPIGPRPARLVGRLAVLNTPPATLRRPGRARRPPIGGRPLGPIPRRRRRPPPRPAPPSAQDVVGPKKRITDTRTPHPVRVAVTQPPAAKVIMRRHTLLTRPPVARVVELLRRPRAPVALLLVGHQVPTLGAPHGVMLNKTRITDTAPPPPAAHETVPKQRRVGPPQPPVAPPLSRGLGRARHPLGAPPPRRDLDARTAVPRLAALVRPRRAKPRNGPLVARPLIGPQMPPVPAVAQRLLGAPPPRTVPPLEPPPAPLQPGVPVMVVTTRPRRPLPPLAVPLRAGRPPVLRVAPPQVARRVATLVPHDAAAPRVANPNALARPRLPEVQVLEAGPPPRGRPVGRVGLHEQPRPRLATTLPLLEPTLLHTVHVVGRPVVLLRVVLEVSGRLPGLLAGPPVRRVPHPRPTRVLVGPAQRLRQPPVAARHAPVVKPGHGQRGRPIPPAGQVRVVVATHRGRREAGVPLVPKAAPRDAHVRIAPARGAPILVPVATLPPVRRVAADQVAVARPTAVSGLAQVLPVVCHAAHPVVPTHLLAQVRR